MKAGAFFAAAEALPVQPLAAMTQGGGLVVVAPHPDDESLGCGGLIAAACDRGVAVRLVVLSDGTGSHPNSQRFQPMALRALRQAETREAALALGLPDRAIRFLDMPDRFVPAAGPEAERAIDAIATAAGEVAAGAVCVTWGHDPHCDHAAAAALVTAARSRLQGARVWHYPVWGWTLPPETEVGAPPSGLRFDIASYLDAKAAAIAAHRSQTTGLIDDDPGGFRLQADMLAHFAKPYETFLEAREAS